MASANSLSSSLPNRKRALDVSTFSSLRQRIKRLRNDITYNKEQERASASQSVSMDVDVDEEDKVDEQVREKEEERIEAPAVPASVRRAVIGNKWVAISGIQERERRNLFLELQRAKRVRTREDVSTDPLRSSRATTGDAKIRKINIMLDSFGLDRTREQRYIHQEVIKGSLPHIYKDEWKQGSQRIMKKFNIDVLRPEILVRTPRRFGKTIAISLIVAVLLLVCPGIKIAVFAAAGRQTASISENVAQYIHAVGQGDRIVKHSQEKLYVSAAAPRNAKETEMYRTAISTSRLYTYPSSVNSKFYFFSFVSFSMSTDVSGMGRGCQQLHTLQVQCARAPIDAIDPDKQSLDPLCVGILEAALAG